MGGTTELVHTVEQQEGHHRMCATIFMDLKGAFDNVTHVAIMTALKGLGLEGRQYRWVSSYLTSRKTFMSTHGGTTNCHSVNKGILQSGALCPTLFNINIVGFTDELPQSVHALIYADAIRARASAVTRV